MGGVTFAIPPLLLLVISLPILPSPTPSRDPLTLLLTLWQVQGGVAGVGIVLFVFLLQTVNLQRRGLATVLTLAVQSGILWASSYGLSAVLAVGIAIGMVSTLSTATWPVILAIVAVATSNFVVVLSVLFRTLNYLGDNQLATLRRTLLLDEVERVTLIQWLNSASKSALGAYSKDSVVAGTFYSLDGEAKSPAWTLRARRRSRVVDIDLRAIHRLASELRSIGPGEPTIQLMASLGNSLDSGEPILHAFASPTLVQKARLTFAIRSVKGSSPQEEEDMLSELSDELLASIRDGDIGRFRDRISLGVAVTERCLSILGELGSANRDEVPWLRPLDAVQTMLRFGLEEALKTRRTDFVLEVRSAVYSVTQTAADAGSIDAFSAFLRLYPPLRRVVLSLGVGNDPLYREIYWRNLTEIARFGPGRSGRRGGDDPEFVTEALGLVESTLVSMIRDSIHEESDDFFQLLDAHRLAFQYDDRPRRRSSRRGEARLFREDDGSHWMALGGWAMHQLASDHISAPFAKQVLTSLAGRFGSGEDILAAMIDVADREGSESGELSSWILSEQAEGIAHFDTSHAPLIASAIAMSLIRWGALRPRAVDVERSHELVEEVRHVSRAILSEGSYHRSFEAIGLLTDENLATVRAIVSSFEEAASNEDVRQRAILRTAPIQEAKRTAFERAVAKEYEKASLFRSVRSVFIVAEEPLSADLTAFGIGFHERLPKGMFTADGKVVGHDFVVKQYAEGIDDGEVKHLQEAIVDAFEPEVLSQLEMLNRLAEVCEGAGEGLLLLGGSTRRDLYRHPSFMPAGQGRLHRDQSGELAGVPVINVLAGGRFAAIYLPPSAVTLRYAQYGDDRGTVRAHIELVDAQRARKIVDGWEEKEPVVDEGNRLAKVEALQESVLLRAMVRSEAKVRAATVFVSFGGEIEED